MVSFAYLSSDRSTILLPAALLLLSARPAHALQPLSEFLAGAHTANVDNREASLTAQAQRQDSLAALGRLLPSASVRGVYTRNELSAVFPVMVVAGGPTQTLVIQPENQWDAFLQLDVPIVDLGAWFRSRAADRGSHAAEDNVKSVRPSVESQVARIYYQLIGASALRRSAGRSLEAQQANADLVKERRSGGIATDLDVSRAQAEVERARQNVSDADLGMALAHRALLTLTGLEPQGEIASTPDDLHEETPLAEWESTPAERIPQLTAALDQRRAAESSATAAKLALLPSLSGTFLEHFTNATSFFGKTHYYALSLNLVWRLDVTLVAQLKSQETQAEIARVREERVRLNTRDAIYDAWNRVQSNVVKDRAARAQTQAALLAAQYASERYQNGAGTQLDVVQAERDAFAAEVGQIQADADLEFGRAQLRLNAGLPLDKDVKR